MVTKYIIGYLEVICLKKVLLGVFASLLIFSLNPSHSSASSLESVNSGVINLDDLEELEANGQVTIEELTYDEFIQEIAQEEGISIEQAQQIHKDPNDNPNALRGVVAPAAAVTHSMSKINIEQEVNWLYKPALTVYVWTYNSGTFREFKYIEQVSLDRDGIYDSYSAKKFEGTIKAKITSTYQFWWMINGDFYNYGEMTVTGGVGGEKAVKGVNVTGTFSVSGKTDHYKYFDADGTYSLY